jgi:hypothetical protein
VGADSGDDEQPDKTNITVLATVPAMAVTTVFLTVFLQAIDR